MIINAGDIKWYWSNQPAGYEDVKKWMRVAHFVKDNEKPCHSRSIGVVIVDPKLKSIVSTGHNGPPGDLPPCDNPDYLRNVVVPQLTTEELKGAVRGSYDNDKDDMKLKNQFIKEYANCGACPRKAINAPSGKRLELCTCIHGETDAIAGAGRSLVGCWMICACGVPCIECTKIILRAKIELVVAIEHGHGDYSPYSSRWMFDRSNYTTLAMINPEEIA